MLGSSLRVWRAFRCSVDKLALGGFACRRAALTPSLSVSADLWSSLRATASVAEMISSWGMCLGAMAKDRPSARTSSSIVESGLELRLITSLLRSSVGCDRWCCVFCEISLLNLQVCLSSLSLIIIITHDLSLVTSSNTPAPPFMSTWLLYILGPITSLFFNTVTDEDLCGRNVLHDHPLTAT